MNAEARMMQEVNFQALTKPDLFKLRNGVSLSQASALLAPESWETYRKNYAPIWILGNAESERGMIAGTAALAELAQLALQLALEQKIALKVLDPPASPTGHWVSLSIDVLRGLEIEDLDIEQSKVNLPDGPILEVRVFYQPELVSAGDSTGRDNVDDAPPRPPTELYKLGRTGGGAGRCSPIGKCASSRF